MSDLQYEWASGTTVLWVVPKTRYTMHERPLRWTLWLMVIRGFRGWLRAYPGLYFGFELFESVETEAEEEEYKIGGGELTEFDQYMMKKVR